MMRPMKIAGLLALLVQLGALGCGGSGLRGTDRDGGGPDGAAPRAEAGGGGDGAAPACDAMAQAVCVGNCIDEFPRLESALCQSGQWVCPSGYLNSKTCPADACAVTFGNCCNPLTGDLTPNPCPNSQGLRPSCPDGTQRSDDWFCIPMALGVGDCSQLDGQACSAEVHQCTSFASVGASYSCITFTDPDAGAGTWHCSYYIGP